MARFDLIFASYPLQGFQDIWFSALEPNEVARLFDYVCQTYGKSAPCAIWVQPTDAELGIYYKKTVLRDIDYKLPPLVADDTVLEDIAIRIENDRLAIDFNSGLEYWNTTRQTAFIHWLRELYRQAPNARLEWAHEGFGDSFSECETTLLQLAVNGV